jgi:hypothetical protein
VPGPKGDTGSSFNTKSYTWVIGTPGAGVVAGPTVYEAQHAVKIAAYVAGGTNCVFNVQVRTAPATVGLNLMLTNMTTTTAGTNTTVLQNTSIAAGNFLVVNIVSASGSPVYLSVTVTCTVP